MQALRDRYSRSASLLLVAAATFAACGGLDGRRVTRDGNQPGGSAGSVAGNGAGNGGAEAGGTDVTGGSGASGGSGANGGNAAGPGSAGSEGGSPQEPGCESLTCASEGHCVTTPEAHCVCAFGYSDVHGDGTQCKDIDECAINTDGCDEAVPCTNLPGTFTCGDCPPGYTGGADGCLDIDECATDNGGCDVHATCTNTDGGRTCECDPGYDGNGVTCACPLSTPTCVDSLTQLSCEDGTLTEETCTGNQATCIEGEGCLSCPGLRCGGTCCNAPPANATAVCTGNDACGVECNTNYHACNGDPSACYPNNDTQHCGSSCAVCSQPNATATCSAGSCAYNCGSGLSLGCLYPDGRPVCSRWDFESRTVEGFAIDAATTTGSDGRFAVSTKHATSGTRSLAVGYVSGGGDEVGITIPLCPNGQGLNLQGRTLSLDLFPETASGATAYGNQNASYIQITDTNGSIYPGCDASSSEMVADKSHQWACPSDIWPSFTTAITLRLRVGVGWSGTFYIDNVRIQ